MLPSLSMQLCHFDTLLVKKGRIWLKLGKRFLIFGKAPNTVLENKTS
jgi:hypothetical protein